MKIRFIDFGYVSSLRSQAIYHGLAEAMAPDDEPILCLANPNEPYMCVGMHQDIRLEIDEAYCQRNHLPVLRRQIGGGTVYLDRHQLFYQFIYPRNKAPTRPVDIYPIFIEPVVNTYRNFGVNARFEPVNDIQVGQRKIGGTGGATINNAIVMAGSFMFDFDSTIMSDAVKNPSRQFRSSLKLFLDEYISTLKKELDNPPTRDELINRFLLEVEQCLNLTVRIDKPTARELEFITQSEKELSDPEWLYESGRRLVPSGIKISAQRYLTETSFKTDFGQLSVLLLEQDMRIVALSIFDTDSDGIENKKQTETLNSLCQQLIGSPLEKEALLNMLQEITFSFELQGDRICAEDLCNAILSGTQHPRN
ncbi:MAG: lipoate--protein ligase family protein [Gammaproteobacteria bacterium]|nr:lipoate--protein ligase family protein [Gammaproteobacteria bacterium]